MIPPRWKKVYADLWGNRVRSVLMVLTIAVGIFAVGFIAALGDLSATGMDTDFAAGNGHSAIIYSEPFDEEVLPVLRRVPGVDQLEGRGSILTRVQVNAEDKHAIQIIAIPPLSEMHIDRLYPLDDTPLPELTRHEVYIGDASLGALQVKPGDTITLELSETTKRQVKVAAIAHDVSTIPAAFGWYIQAYTDPTTLEWLGGSPHFNQVFLTVKDGRTDSAHVNDVAQAVVDRMQQNGVEVDSTFIYNPGRHFAKDIFEAVTVILAILGVLAVFLSTFLIINMIGAMLTQQVRYIGVMKAIGGRRRQIVAMYLALVLCLGVLAFIITAGLSGVVAYQVAVGMGAWLNYRIGPFRFSVLALVLQAAIAIVIPILAAIGPVWNGTRLTVREAISSYGLGKGQFGKGRIDRMLERIRFASRPTLISIRNTFRRKARLTLTLSTLTLAGAIFIAVFNLWTAFDKVIAQVQGYYLADVNITLSQNSRIGKLETILGALPEVTGIEGWDYQPGELQSPAADGTTLPIAFVAPPAGSKLIRPIVVEGRWIQPSDKGAIVVGAPVLEAYPDLEVGDSVVATINDKDFEWQVVGVFKMGGNQTPALIYTSQEDLAHRLNQVGLVGSVRVSTASSDPATQDRVAHVIETALRRNHIPVSEITTGETWRAQQAGQFDVMIYFLLVMAVLIALVGGLGLMGTMSMNVLERSREIGVLRAVGASNGAVLRLVILEGMIIGLISWILGLLLSIPITLVLNAGVGAAILTTPLDFTFGVDGLLLWLGVVTIIAALASALPALNAMRLTVREVLAYE
jgi:putative ABC transport system permease protein